MCRAEGRPLLAELSRALPIGSGALVVAARGFAVLAPLDHPGDAGEPVGRDRHVFVRFDVAPQLQHLAFAGVLLLRDLRPQLLLLLVEGAVFGRRGACQGAVRILDRIIVAEDLGIAAACVGDVAGGGTLRILHAALPLLLFGQLGFRPALLLEPPETIVLEELSLLGFLLRLGGLVALDLKRRLKPRQCLGQRLIDLVLVHLRGSLPLPAFLFEADDLGADLRVLFLEPGALGVPCLRVAAVVAGMALAAFLLDLCRQRPLLRLGLAIERLSPGRSPAPRRPRAASRASDARPGSAPPRPRSPPP